MLRVSTNETPENTRESLGSFPRKAGSGVHLPHSVGVGSGQGVCIVQTVLMCTGLETSGWLVLRDTTCVCMPECCQGEGPLSAWHQRMLLINNHQAYCEVLVCLISSAQQYKGGGRAIPS